MIHYGVIFFMLEKLAAVTGVSNLHVYAAMRGETLEDFLKTRNTQVIYSVARQEGLSLASGEAAGRAGRSNATRAGNEAPGRLREFLACSRSEPLLAGVVRGEGEVLGRDRERGCSEVIGVPGGCGRRRRIRRPFDWGNRSGGEVSAPAGRLGPADKADAGHVARDTNDTRVDSMFGHLNGTDEVRRVWRSPPMPSNENRGS